MEDERSRRSGEVSHAAAAALIIVQIDEGRFVVKHHSDANPVPLLR